MKKRTLTTPYTDADQINREKRMWRHFPRACIALSTIRGSAAVGDKQGTTGRLHVPAVCSGLRPQKSTKQTIIYGYHSTWETASTAQNKTRTNTRHKTLSWSELMDAHSSRTETYVSCLCDLTGVHIHCFAHTHRQLHCIADPQMACRFDFLLPVRIGTATRIKNSIAQLRKLLTEWYRYL